MYSGIGKIALTIDEHFTFSDQISSLSKSCYYHICELHCIDQYLDSKAASTTATATVHSKLAQVSDQPAPTDPELSCTCCCQSTQIQSHHSHPMLSALDKGNWTHWVQVPFTHIQSSQNNLTFTNLKDFNPLVPKTGTSSSINSPLLSPTTPSLFHSRLKTFLFHKSFPP